MRAPATNHCFAICGRVTTNGSSIFWSRASSAAGSGSSGTSGRGPKWIYTVPIFGDIKIFEMPVLGYFGFPPFALECLAMYVFVRRLFWRGRNAR